jgi:hypothetical protein
VPALRELLLRPRHRPACRHLDLRAHQIDAGHRFGDRMLDLQAGVHLEEVERGAVAAPLDQELHRAGVRIAGRCGERHAAAPMRARSAGVTAVDGVSSSTFW